MTRNEMLNEKMKGFKSGAAARQKTPSQRLRQVLWVRWNELLRRDGEAAPFEAYYAAEMERIIAAEESRPVGTV